MSMNASARRAYGFARVSVLKAGLRRPGRVAGHVLPPPPESLPDQNTVFEELLAVYRTLIRGYPELRPVADAMLSRHELANALLMLRVMLHHRARTAIAPLWRNLGGLTTFSREAAEGAATPAALAAAAERSRIRVAAPLVREARATSLASTSLAAERQVWSALDRALLGLPRRDASARTLGQVLVLEQDIEWVRRAPRAVSIDRAAAARATFVLSRDLPHAALDSLAAWTPARGPIEASLPGRWAWVRGASDWDALIHAIRRRRRRLCEQAFVGAPFSLAVPLAVLLLKEEELRTVVTAAEGGEAQSSGARRAYAAGLFGD